MTRASQNEAVQALIIPSRVRMGTIAGVLSCVFGVLGVFTHPIVFVPIALICASFGLAAAISGWNGRALGASFLGMILSFGAVANSPTVWVALGLLAMLSPHPVSNPTATKASRSTAATSRPLVLSSDPEATAGPQNVGDANGLTARPEGADAVDQAVVAAQRFNFKTSGNMSNLSRVEVRMRELSSQFEPAVSSSAGLSIYERRTLLNNLARALAETNRAHDGVNAAKATYESVSADRLKLVETGLSACQRQDLADYRACKTLAVEAPVMKQDIDALALQFDSLEATFQQARQHQEDLVSSVPRS